MDEGIPLRHLAAIIMAVDLLSKFLSELQEVTDWRTLGIHLKVQPNELDRIQQKCGLQLEQCKSDVFIFWLRNIARARQKWSMLIAALKKMSQHRRLVEYLREKYVDSEGFNCLAP